MRRLSPQEKTKVKRQVIELLKVGHIKRTKSLAAALIQFANKKDLKEPRMCCDYRALNKITGKNCYPMRMVDDEVDKLRKGRYYAKIDIRLAYYRIRVRIADWWLTAFRTEEGLFCQNVLPFRLCGALGTWQAFIDDVMKELIKEGHIAIYMDDVVCFHDTEEELNQLVIRVLRKLWEHRLFLNAKKCTFNTKEVKFLGLIIRNGEARIDPARVDTITNQLTPKTQKEVASFISTANYDRQFIKRYSDRALGMTKLLQKQNKRFKWMEDAEHSFQDIKKAF